MTHTLFAEEAPPQGMPPGGLGGPMFPFFILGLMVLFWVVVILPATRRQKRDQDQMLTTLKRGTKVLTNALIVGTIVSAKDGEDEIVIRSEDTRLRIKRSAVIQVIGTDEAESAKS